MSFQDATTTAIGAGAKAELLESTAIRTTGVQRPKSGVSLFTLLEKIAYKLEDRVLNSVNSWRRRIGLMPRWPGEDEKPDKGDLSSVQMVHKIARARLYAERLNDKILKHKMRELLLVEASRRPITTGDLLLRLDSEVWHTQSSDSACSAKEELKVAGRKELPMLFKDRTILGRHDTGAEENFMDEALSKELGLELRKSKQDRAPFSLGNGRLVRAVGTVKALCTFAKEPGKQMECSFYVLKQLASPLIMGFPFLRKTETLTRNRHRLQDSHRWLPPVPGLRLMSSSNLVKRRLHCTVDGREEYVNADSGADLDFMSNGYARSHHYNIDSGVKKRVEMGDRSVAETIGQTSATITLDDGTEWNRVFDVLPNLTSGIVLSDESLETMEIWTRYEASFIDIFTDQARNLELNILVYLGEVAKSVSRLIKRQQRRRQNDDHALCSSSEARDMEDFQELHRRDVEAARIKCIKDESRKQAYQERENRRILRYERERQRRLDTSGQGAGNSSMRNQERSNQDH